MKKTFTLLILFILFFISFPICKASFNVLPRELSITMSDELIRGNTSESILIINNVNESLNISWYIDNPTLDLIRENKTIIPYLTWVNIEPKWQEIPPYDNAYFYIYLDIPDSKYNYNQHWEVWPTFKRDEKQFFDLEHTVRLYIDTPEKSQTNNNDGLFSLNLENIILISIILIVIIIFLFIIRKKKVKKS